MNQLDINQLNCLKGGLGASQKRPLLRPMVKYVANMHGDEVLHRCMIYR